MGVLHPGLQNPGGTVPGDGITTVADFAALLALPSPAAGQRARTAAAVVTGGVPYLRWCHNGTLWRLDGPQDLLIDTAPSIGIAQIAEQALKTYALPAGILLQLRYLTVSAIYTRSGGTDVVTQRLRLGAGSPLPSGVIGIEGNFAAGSGRQRGFQHIGTSSSSTAWLPFHNGVSGFGAGVTTGSVAGITVSVDSLANATNLVLSASQNGATDQPGIAQVIISGA